MKKKLLSVIPYLIVLVVSFYILPLLIDNTGTAMLFMLLLFPLICFLCGLFYGIREGFGWMLTALVIVLYTPTVFIFYNISAWVYVIAYGAINLLGNFIGNLFRGKL